MKRIIIFLSIAVLISIVTMVFLVILSNQRKEQKNIKKSLQEGYGYYGEEQSLGCFSSTGKCDDQGIETTIQYCKPHPNTGNGCIDENGEQTYKTIVKKNPCQTQCVSSKFTTQDGVNVSDITGDFSPVITSLGCDKIIDKRFGVDYTNYFLGDFNKTTNTYPLKSCIPNSENSNFQGYHSKIYQCLSHDSKGSNGCTIICGNDENVLNLTGFTNAKMNKQLLNYFPIEYTEDGDRRNVCYDINNIDQIEKLNYPGKIPPDFVYPNKCYKHSNVLDFNENLWPTAGTSNLVSLSKIQTSYDVSYIDIDQVNNLEDYIANEKGIISPDYNINKNRDSYVKIKVGSNSVLLDYISPRTSTFIGTEDNSNLLNSVIYFGISTLGNTVLSKNPPPYNIKAGSQVIFDSSTWPQFQKAYDNSNYIINEGDGYTYIPFSFESFFEDGVPVNTFVDTTTTYIDLITEKDPGFVYMINTHPVTGIRQHKFSKVNRLSGPGGLNYFELDPPFIFEYYNPILTKVYLWKDTVSVDPTTLSIDITVESSNIPVPMELDLTRSFITDNIFTNGFGTSYATYKSVTLKKNVDSGNDGPYAVLGTPLKNNNPAYYYPLYFTPKGVSPVLVNFAEFPAVNFYIDNNIEDNQNNFYRPEYYGSEKLTFFNEDTLFSEQVYENNYLTINGEKKYFLSSLVTINGGTSYKAGEIYSLYSGKKDRYYGLNTSIYNTNGKTLNPQYAAIVTKIMDDPRRYIKIIKGNDPHVVNASLKANRLTEKVYEYFEMIKYDSFISKEAVDLIFEPERHLSIVADFEVFKSPYSINSNGTKNFLCYDPTGRPLPKGTKVEMAPEGEKVSVNIRCPTKNVGYEVDVGVSPLCGVKGIYSPISENVSYCIQDRDSISRNFLDETKCIVTSEEDEYNTLNNQFSHGLEMNPIVKSSNFNKPEDKNAMTFPSFFTRLLETGKIYQPSEELFIEKLSNNYFISTSDNNTFFVDNINNWRRVFIYQNNTYTNPFQYFFNVFPGNYIKSSLNEGLGKFPTETFEDLEVSDSLNLNISFTTSTSGIKSQDFANQGVYFYWGNQRRSLIPGGVFAGNTGSDLQVGYVENLELSLNRSDFNSLVETSSIPQVTNDLAINNNSNSTAIKPSLVGLYPSPGWSSIKYQEQGTLSTKASGYLIKPTSGVFSSFDIVKLDKYVFTSRIYDSNLELDWNPDISIGDYFNPDFTYFNQFIYGYLLTSKTAYTNQDDTYGLAGQYVGDALGDLKDYFLVNTTSTDAFQKYMFQDPTASTYKISTDSQAFVGVSDFLVFIPTNFTDSYKKTGGMPLNIGGFPSNYPTLQIKRVESITTSSNVMTINLEERDYSSSSSENTLSGLYSKLSTTNRVLINFYIFNLGKGKNNLNNLISRNFQITNVSAIDLPSPGSVGTFDIKKKFVEFQFSIDSLNQEIMAQLYNLNQSRKFINGGGIPPVLKGSSGKICGSVGADCSPLVTLQCLHYFVIYTWFIGNPPWGDFWITLLYNDANGNPVQQRVNIPACHTINVGAKSSQISTGFPITFCTGKKVTIPAGTHAGKTLDNPGLNASWNSGDNYNSSFASNPFISCWLNSSNGAVADACDFQYRLDTWNYNTQGYKNGDVHYGDYKYYFNNVRIPIIPTTPSAAAPACGADLTGESNVEFYLQSAPFTATDNRVNCAGVGCVNPKDIAQESYGTPECYQYLESNGIVDYSCPGKYYWRCIDGRSFTVKDNIVVQNFIESTRNFLVPALSARYIKNKIQIPYQQMGPGKFAYINDSSNQDIKNTKVMSQSTRIRRHQDGYYYINEFRENLDFFTKQEKRTFQIGDTFDYYNSNNGPENIGVTGVAKNTTTGVYDYSQTTADDFFNCNKNYTKVLSLRVVDTGVELQYNGKILDIFDYKCQTTGQPDNGNPFLQNTDYTSQGTETVTIKKFTRFINSYKKGFKSFYLYLNTEPQSSIGPSIWDYQLPYTAYDDVANNFYQRVTVSSINQDSSINVNPILGSASASVIINKQKIFLDYYKLKDSEGYLTPPSYGYSFKPGEVQLPTVSEIIGLDRTGFVNSLSVSTPYSGSAIRAGILDMMVLTGTNFTNDKDQNIFVNVKVTGKPSGVPYFLSEPKSASTSPNYKSFGKIESFKILTSSNFPINTVLKSNKGFQINFNSTVPSSYVFNTLNSPSGSILQFKNNITYSEKDIVNYKNRNTRQYLRNSSKYALPYLKTPEYESGEIPYAVLYNSKWIYPVFTQPTLERSKSIKVSSNKILYYNSQDAITSRSKTNPSNFMDYNLTPQEKIEILKSFKVIGRTIYPQENFLIYSAESYYGIGEIVSSFDGDQKILYRSLKSYNIGNPVTDITSWAPVQLSQNLNSHDLNIFYSKTLRKNDYKTYIEDVKNLNNQNLPSMIINLADSKESCPIPCTLAEEKEKFKKTFLDCDYFDPIRSLFLNPVLLNKSGTTKIVSLANSPVAKSNYYNVNFLEDGGARGDYLSQYLYYIDIEGKEREFNRENCSGNLFINNGSTNIDTNINKFSFSNSVLFNFVPCDLDGQDFIKYKVNPGASTGGVIVIEAMEGYSSTNTRNIFPPTSQQIKVIVSKNNGTCFKAITGEFNYSHVVTGSSNAPSQFYINNGSPNGQLGINNVKVSKVLSTHTSVITSSAPVNYGDVWYDYKKGTPYPFGFIIPEETATGNILGARSFMQLNRNYSYSGNNGLDLIPDNQISGVNTGEQEITSFNIDANNPYPYSDGLYPAEFDNTIVFNIKTHNLTGLSKPLQQHQATFTTTEHLKDIEYLYLPTYDIDSTIKVKANCVFGENYLADIKYTLDKEDSMVSLDNKNLSVGIFQELKNDLFLNNESRTKTEIFTGVSSKPVSNTNDTIVLKFNQDSTFSIFPNFFQKPITSIENSLLYDKDTSVNPTHPLGCVDTESTTAFISNGLSTLKGMSVGVDFTDFTKFNIDYNNNGTSIPGKTNIQVQFSEIRQNRTSNYVQSDNKCSVYFEPIVGSNNVRLITSVWKMTYIKENNKYREYSTNGKSKKGGPRLFSNNGRFEKSETKINLNSGVTFYLGCNLLYKFDQTDSSNIQPVVFSLTPYTTTEGFSKNGIIPVTDTGNQNLIIQYYINHEPVSYDDYNKNFTNTTERYVEIVYQSNFNTPASEFTDKIYYGFPVKPFYMVGGAIEFKYH